MLQDELKEIRTQLRLAMNGVISTSMREKGIVYKLNFGVPLPEIKQIAATHKPDSELAAALWKEDIREFKILASLLQPVGGFSSRKAEQWVKEIPYLEIAEQCSHNLFYRLPDGEELLFGLLANVEDEYARTVGFLVSVELLKRKKKLSEQVKALIFVESLRSLARPNFGASFKEKQAALNALKFYGRLSAEKAQLILESFDAFPEFMKTPEGREIYNDLKFEFEYCR